MKSAAWKGVWRTARKLIQYLPGILNMADKLYDDILREYQEIEAEEKRRKAERRDAAAEILKDLDEKSGPDIIEIWNSATENLKASKESDSAPGPEQPTS